MYIQNINFINKQIFMLSITAELILPIIRFATATVNHHTLIPATITTILGSY